MARRVETLALVGLAIVLWAGPSRAQGRACTTPLGEWTSRCARAQQLELSPSHCPPGRIVVRIGGAAATNVEIAPAQPNSFRRVGGLGLSPIGEFADWSKEPEARRSGFDRLSECVRQDPPPLVAARPDELAEAHGARLRPHAWQVLPWHALGALIAFAIACAPRIEDRRRAARTAALLVLSALVVLGLRWLALPQAFFHQNGHGASWVAYALSEHPGLSSYGPGFAEVFGFAARAAGSEPERGVFLLQALCGASIVPLTFILARGLGASASVSAALGLVIALDPLLARLAQSESYFATQTALAFAAAAALCQTGSKLRSLRFWAAVLAAGLFTAQAARIHPIAWVAFALLPIVVLCGPGSVRRRLRLASIAGGAIAVIVAVTTGSALLAVLSGSLGQQWLPRAVPRVGEIVPWVVALVALAGVVLRTWRGRLLAACAALVPGVMWATNMLGEPNLAVDRAYDRLFWPVLIALAAAGAARVARTRRRELLLASGIAVAAVLAAGLQLRTLTALPTDAEEASLALAWRRQLPDGALVAYVERSENRIFTLPLYDQATAARAFPITLGDGPLPKLGQLAGPLFYYRSSVCSGSEAIARCDELERALALEPILEQELAARPSMRQPYATPTVRVKLARRR